jgi:hypothetical protein
MSSVPNGRHQSAAGSGLEGPPQVGRTVAIDRDPAPTASPRSLCWRSLRAGRFNPVSQLKSCLRLIAGYDQDNLRGWSSPVTAEEADDSCRTLVRRRSTSLGHPNSSWLSACRVRSTGCLYGRAFGVFDAELCVRRWGTIARPSRFSSQHQSLQVSACSWCIGAHRDPHSGVPHRSGRALLASY